MTPLLNADEAVADGADPTGETGAVGAWLKRERVRPDDDVVIEEAVAEAFESMTHILGSDFAEHVRDVTVSNALKRAMKEALQ